MLKSRKIFISEVNVKMGVQVHIHGENNLQKHELLASAELHHHQMDELEGRSTQATSIGYNECIRLDGHQ